MAKTLSNLRAQVRTYLDEVTQADWTDAEVDREVNAAYMELYTAVVGSFEDYYSTKSTAPSVASQQEYTLPTNFYKVRRVEINLNPDNSDSLPKRALPISLDAVMRNLANAAVFSPSGEPVYYIMGNKIGFVPIPEQSGSTAIALWYIKTPDELSSTTDEIDIPFADRYYGIISLIAAATLLRKGQQEEAVASKYMQEAEVKMQKMQIELQDRVSDDVKTIIDTAGEDLDFSAPW